MVKKNVKKSETKTANGKKTICPITREQFEQKAKNLNLADFFDGKSADKRTFASGGLGWWFGDKLRVVIDGVECKVQVGLNISIIGSKELPNGEEEETEDDE